tara:strand:+ start:5338 stop:6963 length:1626 start_codon:yes stop_codon:yes gene_type:complete
MYHTSLFTSDFFGWVKKVFILGTITLLSACSASNPTKNKNVLFIIVDDLKPELGSYGSTYVKSPNIDKIASEGVLFKNAYVQQAVCSASRASFLAGVRPKTTGVSYPLSEYYVNDWLQNHEDISTWFFKNGYYAANVGKIHHNYPSYPIDSLSVPSFIPEGYRYHKKENRLELNPRYYIDKKDKNTVAYEFANVADSSYLDVKTTNKAIEVLRDISQQDKPFFLALGYLKPHLPFNAPKRYWDLYEDVKIKLSEYNFFPEGAPIYVGSRTGAGEMKSHLLYASEDESSYIINGSITDAYALNLRRAYFACVSYIDDQIGLVLNELKAKGLDKNTIVVVIGDHGWHLGDNDLWSKATNFESATRAPFIIYDPSLKENQKGQQIDALVEFVDIYPSLTELAGIQSPNFLEGTSVKPLIDNPNRKWKKAAFSQYPRGGLMGYTIRTKAYRYIEWRKKNGDKRVMDVELYQYKKGGLETRNLAYDENYKDIKKQLADQLNNGWKKALPNGFTNVSNNKPAPKSIGWGPEITIGKLKKQDLSKKGK